MSNTTLISVAANALWAKKNDNNGRFSWMPLLAHLQDTMNAADFLWNHWLTEGQRAGVASQMQGGDEETAERLIKFLGGIHDIGKATPAFQTRRGYSSSEDLDEALLEKLELAGFRGIRDFNLILGKSTHHALAGAVILREMGARDDITSMIGGHHGKTVDSVDDYVDQKAHSSNYYQTEDEHSPVYSLWKNVQSYICCWVLNESELYQISNIPELSKPVQVLLTGIMIMADWIASNEQYFPLIDITQDRVDDVSSRYRTGIKKWFKNLPFNVLEPISPDTLYKKRFGFFPRDFQRIIFDTVSQIKHPGILIIEAPTGCGKTETALVAAEQLAAKTKRSGLFFGLPTQATSNGIFPRINEWLKSAAKDYGTASLRLQHGKAALNPIMNELASHVDEDENDGTVFANQWFSGRKTASLDDFVVGTVDQFLLLALKQKHLMLRHLGFDRKVVVIDEVHAYDAYMQQYLTMALQWMGAYGVPVIMLSATLPAEKREEFIVSYLRGKGIKKKEIIQENADLHTDRYPLITYTEGNCVLQNGDFPAQESRTVQIKKLEENKLYDFVSSIIQSGGVLGIVVNTVARSQELAQKCAELIGKDNVLLLHSGFIATDRVHKEDKLLHLIGKGGERPKRLIVIGTQVIEQSLDIDFDVLVTDLCPMDLLIQRIGRLQRHSIVRPKQFQHPTVYVLGAEKAFSFEEGTGHIYQEYILARTQYFLPGEISIPENVSSLVQETYDFKGNEPSFEGKEREIYENWKQKFLTFKENKEVKAKIFRIDGPKQDIKPERYNLIGWLQTSKESSSDEAAYAQVRDTEETVEIIAVRRCGNGYRMFSAEGKECKDISEEIHDANIAKSLAQETLRIPFSVVRRVGADKFILWLEQYNKKYLASWQEQPWLKGSLGLIFDENGCFQADDIDICLQYDDQIGLRTWKEGRK